jgi:hypothetical protein
MGKQKADGTIRFQATAAQVKTMADGGIRIALDLSESETETAKALMDCRRSKAILEVAILPIIPKEEEEDAEETEDGAGGSARKTRRYPYHS